jgi:hypothetical protein
MGARFRISDKVGLMPLMKFAHAANSGMDTSDMQALAAIYEMLRDCIYQGNGIPEGEDGHDAGDWARFEEHATVTKADAEDVMPVVQQTIELLTARPTRPPSGSSDGPPRTSGNSTGSSSTAPAPGSNGSPRGRSAMSSSRA